MPLTASQRRHLRALAHHLDPVVQLGGAGLTEGVVREVNVALSAHELIKVRLEGDRDARREVAEALAAQTGAEIVQTIGRIAVLYRPAAEAKDRQISLPEQ